MVSILLFFFTIEQQHKGCEAKRKNNAYGSQKKRDSGLEAMVHAANGNLTAFTFKSVQGKWTMLCFADLRLTSLKRYKL